jgi:hypothetical protein
MRRCVLSPMGRWLCVVTGALGLVACGVGRAQTQQPTTTTLMGVQSPINYGDTIADTGVETVSPYPGGGTIDFTINGVVACSIAEPATPPTSTQYCPVLTGLEPDGSGYPVGTYIVQSVYSGDAGYLGSQSPLETVIIDPVLSGPGTSTFGESVTFIATVGDATYNTAGTVNFLEGSTVLGSNAVGANGTASFTTSTLAVGTHNLTACLMDSVDGNTYCSQPFTIVVSPATPPPPPPPPPPPAPGTFTLAVNPASISVGVGNSVTVQVVVTSVGGISPPVQLGCSGLPSQTTCTLGQTLIPAGGGSTTLIVSPAAPHSCGVSAPDFVAPNLRVGIAGLLLSVLALFGIRRRRRWMKGLAMGVLLIAGLGALSALGGCGSKCKNFGTDPTNYTFNVTGTSMGSPPVSQTVTVKLDVHL